MKRNMHTFTSRIKLLLWNASVCDGPHSAECVCPLQSGPRHSVRFLM